MPNYEKNSQKSDFVDISSNKQVKKLYNKKYYIDATTGEIIGGEQSEYFNN